MENFICETCGYVYDPTVGDTDAGITPGMPFEALADDWKCPNCGSPKSKFQVEANDSLPGMAVPMAE
jgi:rubredoxin